MTNLLLCTQILFEGKRAVGVQYMHEGALHEVRATKDVILTSGTVGSAKLLLLSGVGPRNHLQSMKVFYYFLCRACNNYPLRLTI